MKKQLGAGYKWMGSFNTFLFLFDYTEILFTITMNGFLV